MTDQIVYGGYPIPMAVLDQPYNLNSAEVNGRPIRIREMTDDQGRICLVSVIGYIEGHRPTGGRTSGVLETTQEFDPSEVEEVIKVLMKKYPLPREKMGVVTRLQS